MNSNMKKLALAASVAMAFPLMMATPSMALAGIGTGLLGTHHDFASKSSTSTSNYMNWQTPSGDGVTLDNTQNSVGLCSYCHTPHQAFSTSLLWNHKMSANTFTWSDATATAAGTNFATLSPTYKGVSVKCLSCHDGSVAIGDVNLYMEGPGTFNTFKLSGNKTIGIVGSDLKGNHPIGMPYPMGSASTYNGITTGGSIVTTEFQANPEGNNVAGTAWIKLYTDTGSGFVGGGTAGSAGIECSSCHDVHNKQATEDLFLRGKLAGSTQASGYICLQCHIK